MDMPIHENFLINCRTIMGVWSEPMAGNGTGQTQTGVGKSRECTGTYTSQLVRRSGGKRMADYDVIGAVSEAIVGLLRSEMVDREDVISLDRTEISLSSPDEVGSDSDTRLSVYLYKVERNDQRPAQRITDDDIRMGSPLVMELYYLLTAYPSSVGGDEMTNNRDQHSVLGLAMQVLHDSGTLNEETLGESFRDDPDVNISMQTESDDTVSRIWDSFRDVPLYPSVVYEVSPVVLNSRRKEEIQRVAERQSNVNRKEEPKNNSLPEK